MKLNKEPRELGDFYEPDGFDWLFFAVAGAILLGIIIGYLELTGTADEIISSFN